MKNNELVTAIFAFIAGALVFHFFALFFQILPENKKQLEEVIEISLEEQLEEVIEISLEENPEDKKQIVEIKKGNQEESNKAAYKKEITFLCAIYIDYVEGKTGRYSYALIIDTNAKSIHSPIFPKAVVPYTETKSSITADYETEYTSIENWSGKLNFDKFTGELWATGEDFSNGYHCKKTTSLLD